MIKTIYCCDWCGKEVTEPIMLTKYGAPYKDMCVCEKCLPHRKPAKEKEILPKTATKTKKLRKKCQNTNNVCKTKQHTIKENGELGQNDTNGIDYQPKKKLDIGKMQALKNAGWSNQMIADELRTTPGTISNYLSVMKAKEKGGE